MMMTKPTSFHHSQIISFVLIYNITNSSTNTNPTNPPSQNNKNREIEIRVCTNRTCRRQGSLQTLETLVGLAPPHVSAKPCGCLGRCGSGPNLVVLPEPLMVGHCGTAALAARLMVDICCGGGDDEVAMRSLEALSLRKRAEIEVERENFSEAEALFSKVIEAKPIGGIHAAYKGRSAVRLLSGNFTGALNDANKALALYAQYAEIVDDCTSYNIT